MINVFKIDTKEVTEAEGGDESLSKEKRRCMRLRSQHEQGGGKEKRKTTSKIINKKKEDDINNLNNFTIPFLGRSG